MTKSSLSPLFGGNPGIAPRSKRWLQPTVSPIPLISVTASSWLRTRRARTRFCFALTNRTQVTPPVDIEDLIHEIQDEAVDGKSDLSTVLRKLLVFGSQLGHQELKDWAKWELDGYPESIALPDYRKLHGLESFGIFLGAAGSGLQNAPLSLLNLPEQVRDEYANPPVRQGVRVIAEMLNAQKEGTISWAWQPQLARFLITKITVRTFVLCKPGFPFQSPHLSVS
jgi:AbiTii